MHMIGGCWLPMAQRSFLLFSLFAVRLLNKLLSSVWCNVWTVEVCDYWCRFWRQSFTVLTWAIQPSRCTCTVNGQTASWTSSFVRVTWNETTDLKSVRCATDTWPLSTRHRYVYRSQLKREFIRNAMMLFCNLCNGLKYVNTFNTRPSWYSTYNSFRRELKTFFLF